MESALAGGDGGLIPLSQAHQTVIRGIVEQARTQGLGLANIARDTLGPDFGDRGTIITTEGVEPG